MGHSIRNNNFEGSPIDILERSLVNPYDTIKYTIPKNFCPILDPSSFQKSFFALIAPSFAGKTQCAFALKLTRPLYFSLDQSNFGCTQYIYSNFISLSKCLEVSAKKDFETFKKEFDPISPELFEKKDGKYINASQIYIHMNARNLILSFGETEFLILGFIMKLLEDSEENFESSKKYWPRFHAERKSFTFSGKTIKEFMLYSANLENQYCIFLDEFIGNEWAVLIRNLARAVGLPCIVANTNSDIANLTGINQSCASREEGRIDVWSIIFTRLNSTNEVLNVKDIVEKLSPAHKETFSKFLDYVNLKQLSALRPGIACYLIDEIRNYSKSKGSFCEFLDSLINNIGAKIALRKGRIRSTIEGRVANLALCLSYTYNVEYKDLFHRKSFLLNHLYYLLNPVDETDILFLTFPTSVQYGRNLEIYKLKKDANSSDDFSDFYRSSWACEHAYMKEDELITMLSCMAIESKFSVSQDLSDASTQSQRNNIDMLDVSNPEAIKLDGNRLEVLAVTLIIEASHRLIGKKATISFNGIDGKGFLENIVKNVIHSAYGRQKVVIKLPKGNIGIALNDYLGNIIVPFLFVSNLAVPSILSSLTAIGAIKVGQCFRTADKKQIDIKFELLMQSACNVKSQRIRLQSAKTFGIAECKYWVNSVSIGTLKMIVEKSLFFHKSKLTLIFCLKLADLESAKKATKNSLTIDCSKNKVNIFRITKVNASNTFEIVSLVQSSLKPDLVVIVLETNSIDCE